MKPLVGITSYYLPGDTIPGGGLFFYRLPSTDFQASPLSVCRAISLAGGIPILLPNLRDGPVLNEMVAILDGLVFSGGRDPSPFLFGERPHPNVRFNRERDLFEQETYKVCSTMRIPILGICRGMQIINIFAGGDIYQDIHDQLSGSIDHLRLDLKKGEPAHRITIVKGTILDSVFGSENVVNSYHHQAVRKVAPLLHISATSPDGVIEALEGGGDHFILGVQWQPEVTFEVREEEALPLFRRFIEACLKYQERKTEVTSR